MSPGLDDKFRARVFDEITMTHEMDAKGHLVGANRLFCSKIGYCEQQVIGGGYSLFCPEVHGARSFLSLHDIDIADGRLKGDCLIRGQDGLDLWFSSIISPVRNEAGELRGYFCVSFDETERRSLKEASLRNSKLTQMGQLTATVAHEIRNPLGAIRTANFVLERKIKGQVAGVDAQIERINNGIQRCDKIITELLDFSRQKALKTEFRNLDSWIFSVIEEEAKALPGRPSIECALGMPGIDIAFDPDQMRQVLINLLSNAAEALGEKRKNGREDFEPRIRVATKVDAAAARIVVEDNGPGIPPQYINKIREPLFTTKSFGVGLGIPAIMKILDNHGGGLDIESPAGSGARMTARISRRPSPN